MKVNLGMKETKANIIIGIHNDVTDHLEIMKTMEENIFGIDCKKCDCK